MQYRGGKKKFFPLFFCLKFNLFICSNRIRTYNTAPTILIIHITCRSEFYSDKPSTTTPHPNEDNPQYSQPNQRVKGLQQYIEPTSVDLHYL